MRCPGGLEAIVIDDQVKHPCCSTGWACEVIRLVTGEPTRATARLAYPSSGNGAFEGH
jgi:hypothetical protein